MSLPIGNQLWFFLHLASSTLEFFPWRIILHSLSLLIYSFFSSMLLLYFHCTIHSFFASILSFWNFIHHYSSFTVYIYTYALFLSKIHLSWTIFCSQLLLSDCDLCLFDFSIINFHFLHLQIFSNIGKVLSIFFLWHCYSLYKKVFLFPYFNT